MTEIEADLAAINARAAPILAEQARLIKALNAGISLILTLAAFGIFCAALASADEAYRLQQLDRQEASVQWTR